MKEFDCRVSSTRSVCGKVRAEAFTHRHLGKDRREELSQLDYILGPMRRNDEIYIHNARRLWATWDHYHNFREYKKKHTQKSSPTRNKKWTRWKPITEEQSVKFKKSDEKQRQY